MTVGRLDVLVRRVDSGDSLPERLAGLLFQAKYSESKCTIVLGRAGRGEEDLVLPDYGSTMAAARDRNLPLHIFFLAPLERRVAVQNQSVSGRTAPLRPIAVVLIGRGRESGRGGDEK